MTDIVERLRAMQAVFKAESGETLRESANEIERLLTEDGR